MISHAVLMYVSLMCRDVEHRLTYMLAISMSPLENCLFKSLTNFFVILFLLLYGAMSSVQILAINPSSVTWFVGCLFICYFLCWVEAFWCEVVPPVVFCFCCLNFWCCIQRIIAKNKIREFSSYIFL